MPRTAMTNETGQYPQHPAVSAATTGLRSNMQALKLNVGQAQERNPVLNPDLLAKPLSSKNAHRCCN